jgi:enhancing lycopene biosynthesis protein 2
MKKFAVVLAGCGVYDGAEIHEAVATLLAIDRVGAAYQCFAPDVNQMHVVNHLTGEATTETRNVLVEAARIARGNVKPLSELIPTEFDALIFPGGFGVAKNLCTFAVDGTNCSVNPDTERVVREAHAAHIPIGALCITPALIAKVLGMGTLTIGSDAGTAQAVETLGATHQNTQGSDVVIDMKNLLVTTPCYMLDSPISTIADGADNAVKALLNLMD